MSSVPGPCVGEGLRPCYPVWENRPSEGDDGLEVQLCSTTLEGALKASREARRLSFHPCGSQEAFNVRRRAQRRNNGRGRRRGAAMILYLLWPIFSAAHLEHLPSTLQVNNCVLFLRSNTVAKTG